MRRRKRARRAEWKLGLFLAYVVSFVSMHAACVCVWRRRRRVVLYRPRARGESGDGSEVLGLFDVKSEHAARGDDGER